MEFCTTDSGKYRIEMLTAQTFEGALYVIKRSFCKEEPACIGTEVSKNPAAAEELLELCADVALDGVSLVAVETRSGQVVAVAFSKIQVQTNSTAERTFFEEFAEERCKQPSAAALLQCMANLDKKCNFFEWYDVDCSLEIMFLATLQEHRHQRLGTLLCKYSIEVAKRLKHGPVSTFTHEDLGEKYSFMKPREAPSSIPKICQVILSARGTQKIGKVLGFTVHMTVPYTDFIYNGKTYAESSNDIPEYCEVAAKVL